MAKGARGKLVQIIGTVVDVEFPAEELPEIYNAIEIDAGDGNSLLAEVEQHLGNNWVRCLAMDTTDGLRRGAECVDTGAPITVPVGQTCLGRPFKRSCTFLTSYLETLWKSVPLGKNCLIKPLVFSLVPLSQGLLG